MLIDESNFWSQDNKTETELLHLITCSDMRNKMCTLSLTNPSEAIWRALCWSMTTKERRKTEVGRVANADYGWSCTKECGLLKTMCTAGRLVGSKSGRTQFATSAKNRCLTASEFRVEDHSTILDRTVMHTQKTRSPGLSATEESYEVTYYL